MNKDSQFWGTKILKISSLWPRFQSDINEFELLELELELFFQTNHLKLAGETF
jgi:hypothetical protein